jgi:hypothetical protein
MTWNWMYCTLKAVRWKQLLVVVCISIYFFLICHLVLIINVKIRNLVNHFLLETYVAQ